jgi:cell division septation protein DedD
MGKPVASRNLIVLAGAATLAWSMPVMADVKDGVDAWSAGDYTAAVREWQGPADAGDADAMFNLGQAYRLGRGVPRDPERAEFYYSEAADRGHIQAADVYGLLLFQTGRTEQAMPFIEDAASRGDPRSRYLLGIAHFNGDGVPKDWTRAYALLTLANGDGLPQAIDALAQMDEYIALDQRERAQLLAAEMQRDADNVRAQDMAEADFALTQQQPSAAVQSVPAPAPVPAPPPVQVAVVTPTPAPVSPPVPVQTYSTPRVPQRIEAVEVAPSIAAAEAAIAEAISVTGTDSPSSAGADYARPQAVQPQPQAQVAATRPQPQPVAQAQVSTAATSGEWKVQLGAFGVQGNAEKLWNQLSGRSELAGKARILEPSGRLTKLLAGGYATRAAANSACESLKRSGQGCLVTK